MRVLRDLNGRARACVRRFLESTDGNVAMIFGLVAVTVIMAGGAGIDVARAVSMKTRLSSALDAAALAVGTQLDMTEDELEVMAQKFFDANYPEGALGDTNDVVLVQNGEKITLSVTGSVETTLLKIININEFDLNVTNEVTRSANNIEVGLALDITGSMAGTKIADLKVAAKDLVDMIVQDVQTPYYTKLAIAPYSAMVNAGTYAASVRGTIAGPKTVTTAAWQTGANINISGITRANPGVVTTSAAHGLVAGQKIWISGVTGMTFINNKPYFVSPNNLTATTFKLRNYNNTTDLDTSGGSYSAYTVPSPSTADIIRRCVVATVGVNGCEVQVTSAGHGFANGNRIVIKSVAGMTQINNGNNNSSWQVSEVLGGTFVLSGTMPSGTSPAYSAYTSGGSAYCTTQGCEYHRFTNGSGSTRVFQVSTCVSERTGADAFTDAAPTSTLLGRTYPASPEPPASANNPCVASTITPLSIDKAALKTQIDAMTVTGSTAGHLGAAWAWYLVSPNFGYLWPGASQPAAYGEDHLFKVVILMTDGEFNTFYCNDVISQDSADINNYSEAADHKNCNGPNGNAFVQAQTLCTNMKTAGVIVYTVGFAIGSDPNAQAIVANCATDSEHAFYPATGAELKTSFQLIAQEISQLRLSQ